MKTEAAWRVAVSLPVLARGAAAFTPVAGREGWLAWAAKPQMTFTRHACLGTTD